MYSIDIYTLLYFEFRKALVPESSNRNPMPIFYQGLAKTLYVTFNPSHNRGIELGKH
jgi:hypothetical protein